MSGGSGGTAAPSLVMDSVKPAARAMASSDIAVARPPEVRRDHGGRVAMLAMIVVNSPGSTGFGTCML